MSTSAARWEDSRTRLLLRLPDGSVYLPSALEVVKAEFRGLREVGGHVIDSSPSEGLPEITFSRFPVPVLLSVMPPAGTRSRRASCEIVFRIGSAFVPGSPEALEIDQARVDTGWYPVDTTCRDEILRVLDAAGASPGEVSLRQYLAIAQADPDCIVFGDLHEGPDEGHISPVLKRGAVYAGLNARLHPYQEDGVQWLATVADEGVGGILADEMGLGKTLQVIALMLREKEEGRGPGLVVAPATLLENWRRELVRFTPGLSVHVHRGAKRTGFPKVLEQNDVIVTSYETAVRDHGLLTMIGWNIIVLDEAQAVRNPDAQRTAVISSLPRRVGIAVSGTPVENRLRDLWSLLEFAFPGFLGPLPTFEKRYGDDVEGAARLEPIVTPLILRRLVADVAGDLPERIDIPQAIEMAEYEAIAYESVRRRTEEEYGAAATLVSLGKLRQFCTHPWLIDPQVGDPLPFSQKYQRLMEILEEIFSRGEKALVFTSYARMIDLLVNDVPSRLPALASSIDGRTPVDDRQNIIDQYGSIDGGALLVLNPRAAGTGLNITAARHVIHYNPEWNPAVQDQATARAYRRGQEYPVTVHRLFYVGTVEEVIEERMSIKRDLAGRAVTGVSGQMDDAADIARAIRMSPVFAREA